MGQWTLLKQSIFGLSEKRRKSLRNIGWGQSHPRKGPSYVARAGTVWKRLVLDQTGSKTSVYLFYGNKCILLDLDNV